MRRIIITSPSLESENNIGGISAITKLIIKNNPGYNYFHFELGKRDNEKRSFVYYIRVIKAWTGWFCLMISGRDILIHFNISLEKRSLIRDLPLILFARLLKRKMVIHIHGGLYLNTDDIPYRINMMIRLLLKGREPKIVLSVSEMQIIRDRYNTGTIYVLPNMPDLTDAMNFKRNYNGKDTLVMLFLGRIVKDKGIEYIYQALRILKEKGIKFRFVLAGKGKDQEEFTDKLTKILGPDFEYRAIVSGSAKTDLLKECNIFLLPSFYEGLPVSLLECMSFAMVPVVTGVGSIKKVVKNGYNGIIVQTRSYEEIADELIKLDNDRILLKEIGEKARSTILENFDTGYYIAELNKIYSVA